MSNPSAVMNSSASLFVCGVSQKDVVVHKSEAVWKGKVPDVSPVNIRGGSWRIGALREGLRGNIADVAPSCQALHE